MQKSIDIERKNEMNEEISGFKKKVHEIEAALNGSDSRVGWLEDHGKMSGAELERWAIEKAQVYALLLLAEQVKRIADMLDEINDRGSLDQSAKIWGAG